MAEELLNAVFLGADEATARLRNIMTKEYSTEVDAMFGRLHENLAKNEEAKSYEADKYKRIGFSSRQDAVDFASYTQKNGVEATIAPVKLNGQYLVEIPEINNVLVYDADSDASNTTEISAKQLIEQFEQENFVTVERVNDYNPITPNSTVASETNALGNFILQNFDELGSAVIRVNQFLTEVDRYGTNANEQMFTQKLNATGEVQKEAQHRAEFEASEMQRKRDFLSEGGREEDFKPREYEPLQTTKANPELRAGYSQTAQVINGNIVVIGGKEVHDEKVRQYVLDQYNERMEKASRITQKSEARLERYEEKEELRKARFNEKEDLRREKFEFKEEQRLNSWEQTLSVRGGSVSLQDESSFKPKEYKGSTYKAHKAESVKQETMRRNAQSMLDGVYKQEVIALDVATRAGRNAGELDNIVEAINTDAIAMNATASFVLSNDERAAIGKLGMMSSLTNDEKKLVAKVSNSVFGVKDETLTIAERESLSNLISKYTAHQDKSKYGRKLKTSDKNRQDRLRDAHESTLPTLDSFKERIKLSDGEKMMFSTKSTSTLKNLEKDFNIKITKDNPLTRERLLQINADLIKRGEKLGYQFVKTGGKFDVTLLKKLSDRDLAKLGISKSSRDLLAGLNEKGAWGNRVFDGGVLRFGVKAANKLANDEDMAKMINTTQRAVTYTKHAATSVHQFSTAVKGKVDILKAKSVGRKDSLATAKAKPKKVKEPKVRPVNEKLNTKYIQKQHKKLKKLQRSEKSVFTKARKLKDRVMKKIANNKVVAFANKLKAKVMSFIIKLIPYVLLAIVILSAAIALIIAATSIIESIANAIKGAIEFITPDYFDRSASWHLVKDLQRQEDDWIDTVEDFDSAYKDREDLKYGSEYQSFSEYLDSEYFEGRLLIDESNNIYINPFHQAEGVVSLDSNEDALTAINSFNGTQRVGFSANTSVYGEKSADENRPSVSTESGHTSNIKDIVAMADVMFQFESDKNSDGELSSIMGESPAALDWETFKDRWSGFWHNVGTFFAKLFGGGGDKNYIDLDDASNVKTSYRTLQGYAAELFQISHQRYYYLDVGYHEKVDEEFKVDDKSLSTDVASEFGVCTTPVENNFKIYFNGSEIVPCLETESGSRYDLSVEGDYDITLTMDNFSGDAETLCLWDGMGSNKDTWERIKDNSCWEMDSQVVTATDKSYTSGWYSSSSSAKNAVSSYLNSIYNSYAADPSKMGTEQYVLSGDKDNFSCVRYVLNNAFSVSCSVSSRYVPYSGHWHYNSDGSKYWVTDYHWEYQATGTAKMYDQYKEQFTRRCKMHEFKYCGGHLNVTSQGVVFSMTNEQLALCGTYNKMDEYPTIKNYDYAAYGYNKLVGKLFPKEVTFPNLIFDSEGQPIDTSEWGVPNAEWASTHGGSHETPATNVQGSDTARRGLNIYVDENGVFQTGYSKLDESKLDCIHLIRDIFDADCLIDKGKNIFPTGSHYEKYEGWNEDNMTLALLRSTMDWANVYGIDTPIEMKSPVLSTTDDIPKIINALKAHYGEAFDEERQEAVRIALTWVGRGHYNEDHADHAFLTAMCEAKDHPSAPCYDVNCTASDDKGFITFILNRCANKVLENEEAEREAQFIENGGKAEDFVEREYTPDMNIISDGTWRSYGSTNELLPADILRHDGSSVDVDSLPNGILSGNKEQWNEAVRAYSEERFVFYIGVIDEEIKISGSGSEIKIPAGSMLVVDLNVSDNIGTIRLRTQTAESWGDVGSEKNYYWVTNPDPYTEVRKFN